MGLMFQHKRCGSIPGLNPFEMDARQYYVGESSSQEAFVSPSLAKDRWHVGVIDKPSEDAPFKGVASVTPVRTRNILKFMRGHMDCDPMNFEWWFGWSNKARHNTAIPCSFFGSGFRPKDIYFIVCQTTALAKIGVADYPELRLRQLQRVCPTRLRLAGFIPGGRFAEESLHKRFAHLRLHGEWFKIDDGLKEFIGREAYPWQSGVIALQWCPRVIAFGHSEFSSVMDHTVIRALFKDCFEKHVQLKTIF